MARPKKTKEEQRLDSITVNLTSKEKKQLQITADKECISLSQLCLRALKNQKLI